MKNLRFLITVLALINTGLVAQAAAASTPTSNSSAGSSSKTTPAGNKIIIGTE